MKTVVTALSKHKISPQEMVRSMRYADGSIITTYEVFDSFNGDMVTNWPKSYIKYVMEKGQVDRVIQVGYTNTKCEIAEAAEALGIDVFLIRS
jgi:hypothetical protein